MKRAEEGGRGKWQEWRRNGKARGGGKLHRIKRDRLFISRDGRM